MASEGPLKGCRCHFEGAELVTRRDCPVHAWLYLPGGPFHREETSNATPGT
jgi:hypothetical protein